MDSELTQNYYQNLKTNYDSLIHIFRYLDPADLLRVSSVCTAWKAAAMCPTLWRTVRLTEFEINSFERLADILATNQTAHLDLRQIRLSDEAENVWPSFSRAIQKITSLTSIQLYMCPATVVAQLARSNPRLEIIDAVVFDHSISLHPFANLNNLKELRLLSTECDLRLKSDLSALKQLPNLNKLTLKSFANLNARKVNALADLNNLTYLALGDCSDLPDNFGTTILTKLEKLEILRLENVEKNTIEILEGIKNMPKLKKLELVQFNIERGFVEALGACSNIRQLKLIPPNSTYCPTVNTVILDGVMRLNLTDFVWGVNGHQLDYTDRFLYNVLPDDEKEQFTYDDNIPFSKPIPFLRELNDQTPRIPIMPGLAILPLLKLEDLLREKLPTTQIKILVT